MNSTSARMSEASAGSLGITPALPALKPWEVCHLPLICFPGGRVVDAEHASDEQFEAWRIANGIPAKPGAWSFERRCKAINQCRFYGYWDALKFPVACAEAEGGAQNSAESAQKSSGGEDTSA